MSLPSRALPTPRPDRAPDDARAPVPPPSRPQPPAATTRLFKELHRALDHALTALNQMEDDGLLTATPEPVSARTAPSSAPGAAGTTACRGVPSTQLVRIDGPRAPIAQIRFSVAPLRPVTSQYAPAPDTAPAGPPSCEVSVGVEDGPTVRHTVPCPSPASTTDPDASASAPAPEPPLNALSRSVTAFLIDELEDRLDRAPDDPNAALPTVTLAPDGTLRHLNDTARAVLTGNGDARPDPNFLSYVDGRNLRRVMCDLSQMGTSKKQEARWLLRLHVGSGQRPWYRATARTTDGTVRVTLHPLSH